MYAAATVKARSFNSQPPEGGWHVFVVRNQRTFCFNSQPPEGGWFFPLKVKFAGYVFQLTAARRRLEPRPWPNPAIKSFNSQPPEGGWSYGHFP